MSLVYDLVVEDHSKLGTLNSYRGHRQVNAMILPSIYKTPCLRDKSPVTRCYEL